MDELAELESGFEYSYQLVTFIRELGGFSIGTAGFPESHIACTEGKHVDWQRLKAKIDAGADLVLTQLFFDNDDYFAFRDYLVDTLGVRVPLTPGSAADSGHAADQAVHRDLRGDAAGPAARDAGGVRRRRGGGPPTSVSSSPPASARPCWPGGPPASTSTP